MKKMVFTVFQILIGIVLIGKIANWFFDFNDETNRMLNMTMYCLIGIGYIGSGFLFDSRLTKAIIIACGTFLIVINFISTATIFTIIGIICILTPILIARFSPETR